MKNWVAEGIASDVNDFTLDFICKNSDQKKWSRILLPSPYSNQSTWRIPTDQHLCGTWKKNRSKISNFTAVLKYWEFSSRMRKHTTPIQMVQAMSDAITFCEKEKRKEILSERTFLFLWKYIFMKYFNNITKEIFRENAGEIKIRITHQKLFHPIFRVSCTLKKRGV